MIARAARVDPDAGKRSLAALAGLINQPLHRGDRRAIFQPDRFAPPLAFRRATQAQSAIGGVKFSTADEALSRCTDIIQFIAHDGAILPFGSKRSRSCILE